VDKDGLVAQAQELGFPDASQAGTEYKTSAVKTEEVLKHADVLVALSADSTTKGSRTACEQLSALRNAIAEKSKGTLTVVLIPQEDSLEQTMILASEYNFYIP